MGSERLRAEWIGITIAAIVFMGMFSHACQRPRRTPERYLIPAGYQGWLWVEYEVPEAPELPVEDGYLLLRFPCTGVLKTSSSPGYGWARDEYYFVQRDGSREPIRDGLDGYIWGGSIGEHRNASRRLSLRLRFFVGAKPEFHRASRPESVEDVISARRDDCPSQP